MGERVLKKVQQITRHIYITGMTSINQGNKKQTNSSQNCPFQNYCHPGVIEYIVVHTPQLGNP